MTAKEGMDAVIHEVDNTTGKTCNWISNIYSIPCTQTKDLICVNGGYRECEEGMRARLKECRVSQGSLLCSDKSL